jgi:hypothetical protein
VSVDLDEIPHYFAIHGLAEPQRETATLVYDVAMERLRGLADAARIPLTLFAIGRDLMRGEACAALADAAGAGHEIANHTLDHRYDLVRMTRDGVRDQIEGGAHAIAQATGERPSGFRAPGYTVTDEVFDVLEELGVAYDASVFPCPSYYAAKAAALGVIAARGRASRSILDTPRVLLAPTQPYRVARPYYRRGEGLLEIPIQVTRGLRLPFIGTSVTLAGPSRARWLARMCAGDPVVNLELHGIDVLDAADGLEELRPHQPDVRVPKGRKMEAILAAIEELQRAGYAFVTMRDLAREL